VIVKSGIPVDVQRRVALDRDDFRAGVPVDRPQQSAAPPGSQWASRRHFTAREETASVVHPKLDVPASVRGPDIEAVVVKEITERHGFARPGPEPLAGIAEDSRSVIKPHLIRPGRGDEEIERAVSIQIAQSEGRGVHAGE